MGETQQPPRIACPHCAAMIKSPALAAGSLVNCPKCGQGFRIGAESGGKGSGFGVQGSARHAEGERGRGGEGETPKRRTLNAEARAGQARPMPPSAGSGNQTHASSGNQANPPQPPAVPREASPKPRTLNEESRARHAQPAPPGAAGQTNSGTQAGGGALDAEPTRQAGAPSVRSHAERGNEVRAPRSKVADQTIDPNLLAPPPPRAKPKAKEVAVICRLCGSRLYAAIEKIGETIRCPDCHTVNEIVGPKEATAKKDAGPTLEGTEDFGLSDPGERPAYRPIVQPRGEYQVLGALDPAHVDHGWTMGAKPAGGREGQAEAEEEDEIRLEAPAARVQLAPPPTPVTPEEPPDAEEALHDGRYDDNLIGDNVDGKSPDAWKKAPFVYGLVGFLVYPSTLMRLCAYAIGLALLVNLGQFTFALASADGSAALAAPIILPIFIFCATVWTFPFFAAWLAIVQETANGEKEINAWPDWDMTSWIGSALYVPVALFLTGLPGVLGAAFLVAGGAGFQSHAVWLAAPILLSWLVLFPPAIYSMLAEVSVLALVSPHTWRSLDVAKDGWMLFYLYSFGMLIFAALAGGLAAVGHPVVAAIGAVGVVVLAFLYARLLGRLMWYAAAEEARREAVIARRAEIAKRFSKIGQTPPASPHSDQSLHRSPA